jgi:hypothetical protein
MPRALAYDLQRKVETLFQAGGVDDTQNPDNIGVEQRALEVIHCDAFIRRNRLQGISAGKVDQLGIGQCVQSPHAHIDSNAREVRDLVVQAGQSIEQQALARIGAAQ